MNTQLEQIVKQFVDDQHITCPEIIFQSDHVSENALGFIYDLVNAVDHWYEHEENDIE